VLSSSKTSTISIKYFQIYAAPVDYKANNTVGALKPTTLNFANEQDAKNFCEDNKKIDKLYIQKPKSIDIVSSKMNKAQGLYNYLELIGGKYEDMITVGDNINDTHMIKEFRSYAMANGVQSIKDIADYETLGITELIEREI
jgi:hydroxymethylpyrimidine pyrophosphatase-like HAD family hydrolase